MAARGGRATPRAGSPAFTSAPALRAMALLTPDHPAPPLDGGAPRRHDAGAARRRQRPFARAAFYAHLWLGVVFTTALVVIAVTGILLNHKRGLGLMPDVAHTPARPFAEALPLDRLAAVALDTVARAGGAAGPTARALDAVREVDRMDVRPRDGLVKVRLRDAASSEVTVDLASGRVLHVGPRGDVFLEKLHSGEVFGGAPWVLLSDAAAVALVVTLVTGYWLWLAPKIRRGDGGPPRPRLADGGPA